MSFLSGVGSFVSGLFGGGGGGDIFKAILGGIGGSADAKLKMEMAKETAKIQGTEQRKSLDFSAQLEDFYNQKNKARKRLALDSYGAFSLHKRYAPTLKPTAAVEVPTKPVAT